MYICILAGEASCPRCPRTPWGCFYFGGLLPELLRGYRDNRYPVAYLDESYAIEGPRSFYIVSSAVVECDDLTSTRNVLTAFYGGEAMHAAPMYSRNEFQTLREAIKLVSTSFDYADVVVCAPLDPDDKYGIRARAKCLQYLAPTLQENFSTQLFVIDRLSTAPEVERDARTIADLRRAGALHRDSKVIHVQPSREPLLGLPDLVAWAYRQDHVGNDASWFDPLRGATEVTMLE